jgi:hypothetical protein
MEGSTLVRMVFISPYDKSLAVIPEPSHTLSSTWVAHYVSALCILDCVQNHLLVLFFGREVVFTMSTKTSAM